MSNYDFSKQCTAPGCTNEGTKKCATCRVSYYCSKECQKKDWKAHKKKCATLAMTPGGADYRDLYKDKDGVYVFEDHASERSFTLGVHESLIDSIPAVQSNVDMIRTMHRFTGPYTLRKIVRGKPVLPPPPHRLAVGDEVLVAVGPESVHPPYVDGWKRGVVRELHVEGRDPHAYKVQLEDGSVVPAHRDDPDFVRHADESKEGKAVRFDVGQQVECRIGPDEYVRGVIRERNAEMPGWGRGWTVDGKPHPRWSGPRDTVAYLVTPEGKDFNPRDQMSSLSVPADKDEYIRAWAPNSRG
jgi:hypothetical protein